MTSSFAGQWLGRCTDGRPGLVVLDLDDGKTHVRGHARLFFEDQTPGVICELLLPRMSTEHTVHDIVLYWMPSGQASMLTTQQLRDLYPDLRVPNKNAIQFLLNRGILEVVWTTDIGTTGKALLESSIGDEPSKIESIALDWSAFKEFALQQVPGTLIFRGQPEPHKLRTTFHRTYRKDLIQYVTHDIPLAYKQLTARTRHMFNLSDRQEYGAFLNLLQHHGYPTPLLDWSYSPFVAAFFAYRRRNAVAEEGVVRILAFNKDTWIKSYPQLEALNFAQPHFSILDALAIENPRAIPQRALSTLTNLDDIEQYILSREHERGQRYLQAIDLPAGVRANVMAELSLMGITAGSLFPGLDGACEELMGRMFHHQVAPLQPK